MARPKTMRRTLALLLVTVSLVALAASPASAGPRVTCVANGHVFVSGSTGGPYLWQVDGVGPCLDSLQGNYLVAFTGSGTSASLGLCDGLVVTQLSINVRLSLLNLRTGAPSVVDERWSAPVTTFPLATPFLIGGGRAGLGSMVTRVLLQCPPNGNSVATFAFTTLT